VAADIRICKFGDIILNDPNHQSLPIGSLMSYTLSMDGKFPQCSYDRSLRLICTYM